MGKVRLVALAFLACCVAWPAAALRRDLDLVRRASDGQPLQNIYWVSLPLIHDVPDGANTAAPELNKCVSDTTGPSVADGILNSDDLICDWWLARADPATAGSFMVTWRDPSRCLSLFRIGTVVLGRILFVGTPFVLEPGVGYEVQVTVRPGATYSPRNEATLNGTDDPAFAGIAIAYTPTCTAGQAANCCPATAPRTYLLGVSQSVMYRTSYEMLCGLEGVDWVDGNRDGRPDTCFDDANSNGVFDAGDAMTGLYDGATAMTVLRFFNTEPINGPVAHTATLSLGSFRFHGTPFNLVPGEALLVHLSRGYRGTTFLPPHF